MFSIRATVSRHRPFFLSELLSAGLARRSWMATRRDFMLGAAAATLPRLISSGIGGPASAAEATKTSDENWDQGQVKHLIPTVSHDRFLIKASFESPLLAAPELEVGENPVPAGTNAARGDFCQLDISGLKDA